MEKFKGSVMILICYLLIIAGGILTGWVLKTLVVNFYEIFVK